MGFAKPPVNLAFWLNKTIKYEARNEPCVLAKNRPSSNIKSKFNFFLYFRSRRRRRSDRQIRRPGCWTPRTERRSLWRHRLTGKIFNYSIVDQNPGNFFSKFLVGARGVLDVILLILCKGSMMFFQKSWSWCEQFIRGCSIFCFQCICVNKRFSKCLERLLFYPDLKSPPLRSYFE